jgi:hypothetical protein
MKFSRITLAGLCFAISAALSASGCGVLKVRDKNEPQVASIKKAALVSFDVIQAAAAELSFNLGSGKTEGEAGGSMIAQSGAHVDQLYKDVAEHLRKDLHWKVVGESEMISNAGYREAYHKTMDGWQNKMPNPKGTQKYLVKGVFDTDSARILGLEGRDRLMDALGVDALVVTKVEINLTGTAIMGIGSRYPQSNVSYRVFRKGIEAPVWFDYLEGEKSEKSVGATAFTDNELIGKYGAESAKGALKKWTL